jgi:hypothetical protein
MGLEHGGKWLAAARSWLQHHTNNGDRVTWGSNEALSPPLTVRMVEEMAKDVAVAAVYEETEHQRSLLKAAYHLLMNATVKVPGGETDWEFAKQMWLGRYKDLNIK